MSKYDFMKQVEEQLKAFPELAGACIESKVSIHNNDTERYGITIRSGMEDISPIIYVDRFYEDYRKKKKTVEETADEILHLNKSVRSGRTGYDTDALRFDQCRDRILFRLISAERNSRYLEHIPHIGFLNLAIIFTVAWNISESGVESVRVTDEMLDCWGVSVKDLAKLAKENTPRLLSPRCETMIQVMMRFMGKEWCDEDMDFPMLLLSNEYNVYGATSILYEETMDRIGEELGEDFYIIPSSIHEVLILPEQYVDDVSDLDSMIRQINREHVVLEDVLSDRAYFYSRKEKRFYF